MGQIVHNSAAKRDVDLSTPSRRARHVIGARRLAELCERTTDAVRKWDRPMSKGGTGGLVPSVYQARILKVAAAEGLPLEPGDLIAEPIP